MAAAAAFAAAGCCCRRLPSAADMHAKQMCAPTARRVHDVQRHGPLRGPDPSHGHLCKGAPGWRRTEGRRGVGWLNCSARLGAPCAPTFPWWLHWIKAAPAMPPGAGHAMAAAPHDSVPLGNSSTVHSPPACLPPLFEHIPDCTHALLAPQVHSPDGSGGERLPPIDGIPAQLQQLLWDCTAHDKRDRCGKRDPGHKRCPQCLPGCYWCMQLCVFSQLPSCVQPVLTLPCNPPFLCHPTCRPTAGEIVRRLEDLLLSL